MHRLIQLIVVAWLAFTSAVGAQTPEWIWFQKTSAAETRYFRKAFTVEGKVVKAELTGTADDSLEVFLNGEPVLENATWGAPVKANVAAKIRAGQNLLAIRAHNGDASAAGALAHLVLTTDQGQQTIVTDASWKAAAKEEKDWAKPAFSDGTWAAAKSLGKVGVAPWGDVIAGVKPARAGASGKREATPADALSTLPGFKVELIASAEAAEGSWICLTKDYKGRLIISPQHARAGDTDGGLLRVTLGADGKVVKKEFIARPLYDAQGLAFVNGAIYAVVNKYSSKFASGLYRIRDPKGDDSFAFLEP